jgi:hypothetical protein
VGFGGKFGVQNDRQDKSALGWDHIEAAQKHGSQLDHKVVSVLSAAATEKLSVLQKLQILGIWWKIRRAVRQNG